MVNIYSVKFLLLKQQSLVAATDNTDLPLAIDKGFYLWFQVDFHCHRISDDVRYMGHNALYLPRIAFHFVRIRVSFRLVIGPPFLAIDYGISVIACVLYRAE